MNHAQPAPFNLATLDTAAVETINEQEIAGTNGENLHLAEIEHLAALDPIEYELQRKDAAKSLGVRASELDRAVRERRPRESSGAGGSLDLREPEPWNDEVNGDKLLSSISSAIRRYVVMAETSADAAALWAVHTFLLDAFGISPRLAIRSPEKGCGKTTLLDVLDRLVWRPLPTANITTSAVFRVVESKRPTLLIDEADTFLKENEELRGILNSGHRKNGCVIRTVGDDFEPKSFSTWAACAIALIGKLPDTLEDRAVPIDLRRRRPDEHVERFRHDDTAYLDMLARLVARWAADNLSKVGKSDPDTGDLYNRAADNWRPLFAIADAAGGDWPARARKAGQAASDNRTEQSSRVLLLKDIKAVFGEKLIDRLSSADLTEALVAIEGHPWAEWKAGKPMSTTGLARQLAHFGITSRNLKMAGNRVPKGYHLSDFEDAFARYLPVDGGLNRYPATSPVNQGFLDNSDPLPDFDGSGSESAGNPHETYMSSGVADEVPVNDGGEEIVL